MIRVIVRLYPADFRTELGRDIVDVFVRECDRVRSRRGGWAVTVYAVRTVSSMSLEAAVERIRAVRRRRVGRPLPAAVAPASGRARSPRPSTRAGSMILDEWRQDLRYAARIVLRRPGHSGAVVLTLALGIGATTAIFSLVDGVLLRPLPYPNAERIVRLMRTYEGDVQRSVSYPNAMDWREQSTVFDGLAVYQNGTATLTGAATPERLEVGRVTSDFFRVLGVAPEVGRLFRDTDGVSDANVVVLSHGLWRRRFGADPGLIGESITLDRTPRTVIGVTSARFEAGLPGWEEQVAWVPFVPGSFEATRGNRSVYALARLSADATLPAVDAELQTISARLHDAYPDARVGGVQLTSLRDALVGDARRLLFTLLGAVVLVLAIAIVNVTSLLLSRATDRRRELTMRAAIGAGRARLVRQLLTEAGVLSSAGCLLGLGVAVLATDIVVGLSADSIPLAADVRIDWRVLGFAAAVTALTALLVGTGPALRASEVDLSDGLRVRPGAPAPGPGRGRGGGRGLLQSRFVALEVALALLLLVGAGLVLRSFWRLTHVDLGFDAASALTFRVDPPQAAYPDAVRLDAFFHDVAGRLRALPGVRAVGAAHDVPLDGSRSCGRLYAVGQPPPPPESELCAEARAVRDEYFEAMGIPLLRGRTFTGTDEADTPPVVIVNQALANLLWPDEDPLGKRMFTGFNYPVEVVGMVGDVVNTSLDETQPPQTYIPWAQWTRRRLTFVVRTEPAVDPRTVVPLVREAMAAVDGTIPVTDVLTMAAYVTQSVTAPRFRAVLLGAFSLMALLLTLVGVYGVLAYSVARRHGEIAIRMALGAAGPAVARMIFRQGLAMVSAGIVLGVAAALALTRVLSSFLFEVTPTDPAVFGSLTVLLVATSLGAMYVPARRAVRADPSDALREH